VHVDDVASAIASALMRPSTGGHAYDVAGPEPLTFRQLVREGAAAVGRRPLLFPIPLRPAVAAIGVYERVSSNPRLWAEQLERLGEDKAFDITPAQDELGFNPRSFTEGVQAQAKGGAP
jgi:nucleoside-diphosphate-sugar epimerase